VRTFSPAWFRPIAFVTANAAAVLLLCLAVVAPAIDFLQDQRRMIEQGALTLERTRAAIARNEAVSAIAPVQIEAAAQRFVRGDGEGLQNADLLGRLRQAAEEHGVSLGSAATLPPRTWSDRRLVGARVDFVAPTERAARFLSSLEYGPALIFIDRATLSPDREGGEDTIAGTVEVYGVTQWPEG
jgi:hypothetical protein